MNENEFDLSEDILREIKGKELGHGLYESLLLRYGKRGEKAFIILKENRVKRYRDFFVVVGGEEYIVEETHCSCKDFQINLRQTKPCAHIIAIKIAKKTGLYDRIDLFYLDFLGKK